jgi:HD-GYP domain-containing protein (c-di-GMP phosphodiesterase class II)
MEAYLATEPLRLLVQPNQGKEIGLLLRILQESGFQAALSPEGDQGGNGDYQDLIEQTEEALKQSEARYRNLFENSPISLWEEDFSQVNSYLDQLRHKGVKDLGAYLDQNPQAVIDCMRLVKVVDVNQATLRLYKAKNKDELNQNLDKILRKETLPLIQKELVAIFEGKKEFEGSGVNFKLNGEQIDCIVRWSLSAADQNKMSSTVVSVVDVTEQKEAEARIRAQVDRLAALRTVDMAITASLDLRVTLDVLLDQVTMQLQVQAADILLLDSHSHHLSFAAGRGFRGMGVHNTRLHISDPYAGRSVMERRGVTITNLAHNPDLLIARQLQSENFQAYFCVPLISKGQIKGVLEIFHNKPLLPNPEWVDFMETMAGQAAIAIDNASLFEKLQRSNLELSMAYDATIEGWSRALDLRDKETVGHTERVTETTVALAMVMGFPEEDIVHLRRGALLHDIGKMGISDQILFKPGPLNDQEWEIMRKHPEYAFELLSPISYLLPAIDIPYCHHERWDGSGYPRGLKAEEIPLAARIFAVVDVWDALRNDRPYRKAWSEEAVREYINQNSGRQFDPQAAVLFLNLTRGGEFKPPWLAESRL